ncbi:MAG: hypothetical protein RIQ93_390 [Verrucomicrobiota bacterium]|jgi:hypothetical protein
MGAMVPREIMTQRRRLVLVTLMSNASTPRLLQLKARRSWQNSRPEAQTSLLHAREQTFRKLWRRHCGALA